MTRQKRTFEEWEKAMTMRIVDAQEVVERVINIIINTPLQQTAEEKCAAIDALEVLERQLRGELHRARRKHLERQKTVCQMCGEYRAEWRTEKGQYLCTGCACRQHHICEHTPRCEYCGTQLYGWTNTQLLDDHTGRLYCSQYCALKASGCEDMMEDER